METWEYGMYFTGSWEIREDTDRPSRNPFDGARGIREQVTVLDGCFEVLSTPAGRFARVWEGVGVDAEYWRAEARRNELGAQGWRFGEDQESRELGGVPAVPDWMITDLSAVRNVGRILSLTSQRLSRRTS